MVRHLTTLVLGGILGSMVLVGNAEACHSKNCRHAAPVACAAPVVCVTPVVCPAPRRLLACRRWLLQACADLCTQGEVLQDHPAQALPAQVLPEEDVRPPRSSWPAQPAGRLRCPGRLSGGLATGLGSALTGSSRRSVPANLTRYSASRSLRS